MVQSGPEGFFRQIIKPRSKRLNKRGIGRPRGAMGAPPPQHMVDMGDHLALVEPHSCNPQDVSPVNHIFVRDTAGKETHIRLYPGIRDDQVRKALENAGLCEMKDASLHCSPEHWSEHRSLLQKLWPNARFEERDPTPVGVHPETPGKIKFVVNTHYFQAVAKIAFHYFLRHSRRGFTGAEPYFAAIRDYIANGGNHEQFFKRANGPAFVLPFGEIPGGDVVTPGQWCHVLAACEGNREGVSYVQLFVGPGCIPAPYYVWLGRWDSPIITPNSTWAHLYLYDQLQQDGRYAGRVEPMQVSGPPAW